MEWVRRISMADLDSRFGNEWVRRIWLSVRRISMLK
jgi:hypothetical protein